MKTPWSSLLQHGTAFATMIVVSISIICLMIVVAVAVGLTKFLDFIK